MNTWKKVIIGLLSSFIVIILVIFYLSYHMLKKSLPDYSGSQEVIGLNSKVEIYRNDFAIPMIKAENDEDAAYALGYVHAQERLFQMDIARRAGEGRLSEIFGSKTIPIDRMFRTIGLYRQVRDNYDKLNPLSKKILEAYAKGVNEFIKEKKGTLFN